MGTWLNPIDRSITTKYRIGCTKFSILSLITLSKLQYFFAKFFKKQFPQRKYKMTYRICCYFFSVCVFPSSFYSWKFVLKQYFYNMILQQLRTTSGPSEHLGTAHLSNSLKRGGQNYFQKVCELLSIRSSNYLLQ